MVEILQMPYIERSLTATERRAIHSRKRGFRRGGTRSVVGVFLLLFLPFLILALISGGGRLSAGDLQVLGIYALILIVICGWAMLEDECKLRKRRREWDQALETDKVRETKVESDRVWFYDEIEDEGPVYLFELRQGGLVALLGGQEFYPDPRFPNTDFSIIEILSPTGQPMDMLIKKRGRKLQPEKLVRSEDRQEEPMLWEKMEGVLLASPGPVGLLSGSLDDVEKYLRGTD